MSFFNKIIYSSIAVLTVLTFAIFKIALPEYFHYSFLSFPALIGLYTLLMLNRLQKASKKTEPAFANAFMALTGLKLLVFLIVLGICFFTIRAYMVPALVLFLINYMIFTFIEVKLSLRINR